MIFDPKTVHDRATFEDPHHVAEGFSDIIVNGTPVLRQGALTGARPGGPLRREEPLVLRKPGSG